MFIKNKKGFTLLEILLVVGIIAILAGIVIVAINPSKQLAMVRNSQRKSDIKQVANAITQFYIDHSYYPASTTFSTTSLMTICPTGASTSPAAGFCTGMLNLSELVPTYLTSIPNDPGTTTTSGYSVVLVNKNPAVSAPLAELGVTISVGNVPVGCSATGGTISTTTGYKIHTFTSSGTFSVSGTCAVEVLVVAGGGGGAGGVNWFYNGGGGGAGGLIYSSTTVSSSVYNVVVGLGGNGGIHEEIGVQGQNSTAFGLEAVGGGYGAYASGAGGAGGSGGGSGGHDNAPASNGGAGTAGQGNKGGNRAYHGIVGSGGGGAGSAGTDNTNIGGAGLAYSISGSSITYATGGTGAPGYVYSCSNGAANTGNGGGGGGASGWASGCNGGSGVVIVRYAN